MKNLTTHFSVSLLITLLIAAVPATADVINFDAEAVARAGNLTGIPDSPLNIGIATFTGGELLDAEVGLNVDQTGVYASEGIFGSGETNPVTITFASAVSNVSIFVANGDDVRSYTVTDNVGDSVTESLASAGGLGAATFSLPGAAITSVQISSANAAAWDFAFDNVAFAPAATAAPEPDSLLLFRAVFCR
jgi:hypothetical protein